MIPVKDFMQKRVAVVSSDSTCFFASKRMVEDNTNTLVVTSDSVPVGMITRRDIIREVIGQEKDADKALVREVMTSPVVSIDVNDSLAKANKLMKRHHIKQIVVVENKILAGLITQDDITKAVIKLLADLNKKAERINISVEEFQEISEQFYMMDGYLDNPDSVPEKVSEIMTNDVVVIPPTLSVLEASKIMGDFAIGSLIIEFEKMLVGIITERDMIDRMLIHKKPPADTKISDIMSKPVVSVSPDLKIRELIPLLMEKDFSRFPVVYKKKVIGIVTQSDILKSTLKLVKATHWRILKKWGDF